MRVAVSILQMEGVSVVNRRTIGIGGDLNP